jgi:RimJ/RimL family protein N-acetyltransferase
LAGTRLATVLSETARLLLRPIEPSDLDGLTALHADPEVTRFIRPLDRAAARARIQLAEREWEERGYGLVAVLDRKDGKFLGRAGLKYWPEFDETELGWALRRDAWGHGYATEASRACLEWGLSEFDMPYLTAMIDADNVRSVRVAERLGLAPIRDDVLLGDPVVVYGTQRSAP